jgi:Flp pilus assembly protein TadG
VKIQRSPIHKKQGTRAAAKHRRGAMLVLVLVMIVAFIVTVAFSVDIAYMNLVKSELRSATDAAAKATSAHKTQSRIDLCSLRMAIFYSDVPS